MITEGYNSFPCASENILLNGAKNVKVMSDTLKIIGRRLSKKKVNFKSASPSVSASSSSSKAGGGEKESSSSSSSAAAVEVAGFQEDVRQAESSAAAAGYSTRTKLIILLLFVLAVGFATFKVAKNTSFQAKASYTAAALAGVTGGYFLFVKK